MIKNLYYHAVTIGIALTLFSGRTTAQTATFSANGSTITTGSLQTWTVPSGITKVRVTASGGRGGASSTGSGKAGKGASITALLSVTPGETLYILVGKAGYIGSYSGGGGGGSFVTRTSFTPSNLLIGAGGGGGATGNINGSSSSTLVSTAPSSSAANGANGTPVPGFTSGGTGGTGGGNGGSLSSNGLATGGYGGGGSIGPLSGGSSASLLPGGGGGGGGFDGGAGGNAVTISSTYAGGGGGGGGAFGGTAGSGGANGTTVSATSGGAGTSWVTSSAINFQFTASTTTGDGSVTIAYGVALPLKLISFTGSTASDGNRLAWATATEDPGTAFTIERSSDARTFSGIGSLAGKGNTADYVFQDQRPLSGNNFYRLKINEPDGVRYSQIVTLRGYAGETAGVLVSPVPVTDIIRISLSNEALSGSVGTIHDVQGRVMCKVQLTGSVDIDARLWPAGNYVLRLQDGSSIRIVKQ